jgi:hypothetical protein
MTPLSTRWHIETKREVDEVARYRQIDEYTLRCDLNKGWALQLQATKGYSMYNAP